MSRHYPNAADACLPTIGWRSKCGGFGDIPLRLTTYTFLGPKWVNIQRLIPTDETSASQHVLAEATKDAQRTYSDPANWPLVEDTTECFRSGLTRVMEAWTRDPACMPLYAVAADGTVLTVQQGSPGCRISGEASAPTEPLALPALRHYLEQRLGGPQHAPSLAVEF